MIGDRFPDVLAYRRRVLARPSVTRVVDEARPYREPFPQGAPDRLTSMQARAGFLYIFPESPRAQSVRTYLT
jgi:hypothetical protein